MTTATVTWRIGETNAPPPLKVPGIPVMGNALQMSKDPTRFIVEMYQRFGPIFRIQLMGQEVAVLAGLEANQFTTQCDEEVFTNELAFAGLQREFGPIMTAQANPEHRHLRRIMRPAYGRSVALEQVNTLIKVVDDFVEHLSPGDSFEVFPTMQKLVVDQLGYIMRNQPVGEYFDDVRTYMKSVLQVYQFHTRPRFILKMPAYRRAKTRTFKMARAVLDNLRQSTAGADRRENSIDLLMKTTDKDGQPFSEAHLLSEAMGPYLAGQDTVAGTLSFIFYMIHKHPELLERLIPEATEGLLGGTFDATSIRKFETLHNTIVETMRLHPVAPFMPRHAAQTFEFAGHKVMPGESVYSATAVTHFLPEFYPEPYTFNIDRPRGPAGTFVPYGVGNFACLGTGLADVQLLFTTAAILRRGRFVLDPLDYEAKLGTIPLPNPGQYRLKLVEKY